ncbi:MAG: hypothetical protein IKQ81_07050 [Clostridiales bacterium]|nr:hypothetical protein [Clostridiales bacterium]
MSEEKKYSLTEYVFRDIRFGNEYPKFANNDDFKQLKTEDPVMSAKNYHKLLVGNYKSRQHAERWQIALDSYKKYKCFESKEYSIDKAGSCLYFSTSKENRIRISADTLTGPSEIINPIPEDVLSNNTELKASLNEFCRVAYTVGNVCPVMMNPGGRKGEPGGVDTCWNKLKNHLDSSSHIIDINKAYLDSKGKVINHLGRRTAENMFCLFPEDKDLNRNKVIDNLMLNDYYDDDYNLIITATPKEYAEKGVDEYIKFIRLVTALIIKRGIRIYNALPDDMKKSE